MTVSSNTEFPLSMGNPPLFFPFFKDLLQNSLLTVKPRAMKKKTRDITDNVGADIYSQITVSYGHCFLIEKCGSLFDNTKID